MFVFIADFQSSPDGCGRIYKYNINEPYLESAGYLGDGLYADCTYEFKSRDGEYINTVGEIVLDGMYNYNDNYVY